MAAPSLAVDWEAVRAHAVVHGVRDAARAFEINPNTVLARSYDEGWLKEARELAKPNPGALPKSMQPIPIKAIKPSEAARRSLLNEKSRYRAAKLGDKLLRTIGKKRDDALIACAQPYAQTVGALAKVQGWDQQVNSAPLVNLSFQVHPTQVKDITPHAP